MKKHLQVRPVVRMIWTVPCVRHWVGNGSGLWTFSCLTAGGNLLFYRIKEQAEAAAEKEKEAGSCWMGNVAGSRLLPCTWNGVGPRCRVGPIVSLQMISERDISVKKKKKKAASSFTTCWPSWSKSFTNKEGWCAGNHTNSRRSLKLGIQVLIYAF